MSSLAVRTAIKGLITSNLSGETLVDISFEFQDFKKMLGDANVQPDAPWLGIEFLGESEIPVGLTANNVQGKYREFGSFRLHVCSVAKIGADATIMTRTEALRDLFRGQRIGDIIITAVQPPNSGIGATLDFEGGYMSASFFVDYQMDKDL